MFAVNGNGNISLKDKKDKSEEIIINTYMGTFHIRELTDESIKEDMLNKIMEYKKLPIQILYHLYMYLNQGMNPYYYMDL